MNKYTWLKARGKKFFKGLAKSVAYCTAFFKFHVPHFNHFKLAFKASFTYFSLSSLGDIFIQFDFT